MTKRFNKICECKDHGFAQLTRGLVALFSPEDFASVADYNWYANPTRGIFYASRRGKSSEAASAVKMHKQISDGQVVDHINNDSLDNRRENLRPCTQLQNTRNAKPWGAVQYKGVSFHKITGKYRARIRINGQTKQLGVFDCAKSAAAVYNRSAAAVFGEFAYLNEV